MSAKNIDDDTRIRKWIRNDVVRGKPVFIYGLCEYDYVQRLENELHVTIVTTEMKTEPHETPYWLVERKKK